MVGKGSFCLNQKEPSMTEKLKGNSLQMYALQGVFCQPKKGENDNTADILSLII